ncbi:GLPGLI family protein [Pedobacter sp. Hv1]|uniref:GLPGLI family protein n=1 Tax=Pedobacter sp. Hv1 TaxID=1740090 RepID=UPI0006D8BE79|nr:GLPGLI family protein [Pedobacter sp. Hv1]KQB98938.1 hypothetical protein AQF98_19610 [Pedobacter sp. Hv1]
MKAILILFFTITTATLALAQSPDKVLARVRYNFVHVQDTTQKDTPYTENMVLAIGKNASLYASKDGLDQTLTRNNLILENAKKLDPGLVSIQLDRTSPDVNSKVYFFFAKENKFITKERVFNNYLVEEIAPKINWTITADTINLSGVHCKKAQAYFKGRNWTAWYAIDLPFQSGPWKLNGLPGLIVEAYDEKKEVQFLFAGLENTADPVNNETITSHGPKIIDMDVNLVKSNEIKLPSNAIRTTQKELDKLKDSREKDPQGFMNAQMSANGIGYVKAQRKATVELPKKAILNNPIELPEKKN